MDASWLALAVAGISTVPGTLVWLGARADRRAKARDVVVGGYDRLVDDLESENKRQRRDNADLRVERDQARRERDEARAELERVRADRRPRPSRGGGR